MVPEPITRRRVLAGSVSSTIPLVSGCASLSRAFSEPASELGRITVENSDDAPHTIHVAVAQNSELVYGASRELEAVSTPDSDDDFGSIDGDVLDDSAWADDSGDWTVHTRVDDETDWAEHAVPTDDGTACHAVRLKIEDDASVTSFTPDCESWPPDGDQ